MCRLYGCVKTGQGTRGISHVFRRIHRLAGELNFTSSKLASVLVKGRPCHLAHYPSFVVSVRTQAGLKICTGLRGIRSPGDSIKEGLSVAFNARPRRVLEHIFFFLNAVPTTSLDLKKTDSQTWPRSLTSPHMRPQSGRR